MKAKTITFERLVTDGDYCNRKLGITLELEEGDSPTEAALAAAKFVDEAIRRSRQISVLSIEASRHRLRIDHCRASAESTSSAHAAELTELENQLQQIDGKLAELSQDDIPF